MKTEEIHYILTNIEANNETTNRFIDTKEVRRQLFTKFKRFKRRTFSHGNNDIQEGVAL